MNPLLEEKLLAEYEATKVKYQHFLELYPKLIRGGFITILVIPLIFMILMFSVESRLVYLVLWVTSIILIAGYLIAVEYIYYRYKEKFGDLELAEQAETDSSDILKSAQNKEAKSDEDIKETETCKESDVSKESDASKEADASEVADKDIEEIEDIDEIDEEDMTEEKDIQGEKEDEITKENN